MQNGISDLMDYIKELEEVRCKSTRLCVCRLVTTMTKPMTKRQPLFLNKCAETIECTIEWIEH